MTTGRFIEQAREALYEETRVERIEEIEMGDDVLLLASTENFEVLKGARITEEGIEYLEAPDAVDLWACGQFNF